MRTVYARIFIICLISCCIAISELGAAGATEEDQSAVITKIDDLIAKKQYDLALTLAGQIVKTSGDYYDEAQKRITQILVLKNSINTVLEDIAKVIEKDPGNTQAIVALVEKVKVIQPDWSTDFKKMIDNFYVAAKLKEDRNKRDAIFKLARTDLSSKDYLKSFETYLTGFTLQRPQFDEGLQDKELKTAVIASSTKINENLTLLITENTELDTSIKSFLTELNKRSGSGDYSNLELSFSIIQNAYLKVFNNFNNLNKELATLKVLKAEADKKYPDEFSNEYIQFIIDFMDGYDQVKNREGILASFDFYNNTQITRWMQPLTDEIARLSKERDDLIAQEKGLEANLVIDKLQAIFPTYRVASFAINQTQSGTEPNLAFELLPPNYKEPFAKFWLRTRADLVLRGYLETWFNAPKNPDLNAKFDEIKAVYEKVSGLISSPGQAYVTWQKEMLLTKILNIEAVNALSNSNDKLLTSWYDKISKGFVDLAHLTNTRLSELEFNQASTFYNDLVKNQADVVKWTDGPDKKFPNLTLTNMPNFEKVNADAISLLDTTLGRNESALKVVSAFTDVQNQTKSALELKQKLASLKNNLALYKDKAQKAKKLAEDKQKEVEGLLAQARDLLIKQKPDEALGVIDSINLPKSQSLQSWYQEDFDKNTEIKINKAYDKDIVENSGLRPWAKELRKRVAIPQVQNLLSQAEVLLQNSEYETALKKVDQAEKLHATNIDSENPDPDIVNLSLRIKNAANATLDLYLVESDPNYSSVSNFLNIAGSLINKAKDSEGEQRTKLLNLATQNIESISLIKPKNFAAAKLRLTIKKVADEKAFKDYWKITYDNAVKLEKTDATGAFSIYKALQGFDDNNLIRQKIASLTPQVFSTAPIKTPEGEREADRLIIEIRASQTSTNKNILKDVLTKITQVRNLGTKYNAELDIIKGKIQLKLGASSDAQLSPADHQRYNEALRLKNSNQKASAKIIVRELYTGENKKYGPLSRLYEELFLSE